MNPVSLLPHLAHGVTMKINFESCFDFQYFNVAKRHITHTETSNEVS